ncbi:MAG: hypothetical protein L0271_13620 [Gemmatimonadetes bacterium]|nr:hypothetical protein [Gemmatimonadota bacterium]
MTLMRTAMLLAGVVSSVQFPILVGHALSRHESGPLVTGVVLLGVGIILVAIAIRLPDRLAERH